MPSWLAESLIRYLAPILIQALTPIIVEYTKIGVGWLGAHLPKSAMVTLAAGVAEGVNQAQSFITGASLPPGVGSIISIFLNELAADFHRQPPTPGVSPYNAV